MAPQFRETTIYSCTRACSAVWLTISVRVHTSTLRAATLLRHLYTQQKGCNYYIDNESIVPTSGLRLCRHAKAPSSQGVVCCYFGVTRMMSNNATATDLAIKSL